MSGRSVRAFSTAVLAATAGAGHFLYPLWLAVMTRKLADPLPPEPEDWPLLSVVIPAYREAAVIGAKVKDLEQNGYPGPLEVIIVADDEETAGVARTTGAHVVSPGERLGKAEALNRGVSACSGQVVAITDANARLVAGSLAAMTRWFEDPRVGAVTGEKMVTSGGDTLYWRFESWLKQHESRLGTTPGLVGEVAAIRRSIFLPIPGDVAVDDFWIALSTIEQGYRVVFDPKAASLEEPNERLLDDWERRTRMLAGCHDVLWRRRRQLIPGRGTTVIPLWGHKVFRSTAGPLAHVALVLQAGARCRSSWLARAFLFGHVLAASSLLRSIRSRTLTMPERLMAQTLFLQATAIGGMVRYLKGDRPAQWPKPDRTSGLPGDGAQTQVVP